MARPIRRENDDDAQPGSAPRRQAPQGLRWWFRFLRQSIFDPYGGKRAKQAQARREILEGARREDESSPRSEDPGLAREPEPVICAQVTPWGLIYLGVWGEPLHPDQAAERLGWELEVFLQDASIGPDGEIELPEDP